MSNAERWYSGCDVDVDYWPGVNDVEYAEKAKDGFALLDQGLQAIDDVLPRIESPGA